MDPRTVEINNLRILNDYLNQTIEAMVRAQRVGLTPFAQGLSHSPFAGVGLFGAQTPFTAGFGVDPVFGAGLSPFAGGAAITPPYAAAMIDPLFAQRGLSHTTTGQMGAWGAWNPIAELARQQQLLATYRTWGVPV
jgi:hypothetical protein